MEKQDVNYDLYAFHITKREYMDSIIKNGLLPLNGDRSKSVGEEGNGYNRIYFFTNGSHMQEWITDLYPDENIYDIELLMFNLKGRVAYCENGYNWYLIKGIKPEKIQFLRLRDLNTGEYVTLNTQDRAMIEWKPLSEYEPFTRKRS